MRTASPALRVEEVVEGGLVGCEGDGRGRLGDGPGYGHEAIGDRPVPLELSLLPDGLRCPRLPGLGRVRLLKGA